MPTTTKKPRSKPLFRRRYYRLNAPIVRTDFTLAEGDQVYYLGPWDSHGRIVIKVRPDKETVELENITVRRETFDANLIKNEEELDWWLAK